MANHALPTTSSLYTDVLTNLKDRIDDSLKMLDSVNTSPTNVPTYAVRWNSTTKLWEKYNGSEWDSLAASYAIQVLKSSNLVGGNSTKLLGSIPYQSNTDNTTLLAPNTTTTRKFLRQTGSGTNGSAPVWDTILASDVPTLNQNTTGNAATATTATTAGTCTGISATVAKLALSDSTNPIVGSNSTTQNTIGYVNGVSILGEIDGAIYTQAHSNDWQHQIFGDYRTGKITVRGKNNGTWKPWKEVAYTDSSITGNASTATALVGDETNWATYRSRSVANMLSWKNYGNGHCIFDASNGTSPTGSAVNNTNPYHHWNATFPTLMGWSGDNTFGVRVDSARVADSTTYASAFTTAVGSAPSYACRAWVNFNGTGTVAIRASGNVSSITDNGTGNYTVNFTTAMVDANYFVGIGVKQLSDTTPTASVLCPTNYLASSITVIGSNEFKNLVDHIYSNVSIFR